MNTRKLGWTNLELTTIGLGTWAHGGGGWEYSWGPQDDRESIATIVGAVEQGINWIDTAPGYGLGHAEEILGKALKELPVKPYVATKCGFVWGVDRVLSARLSRDSVRREIDASLKRLGVDVIDLYQIHWPNPESDIEEAWEVIARHIEDGVIRYAGVSNFTVAQMERLRPIHPIASLQPPYSMLKTDIEDEILDYCATHRIGVVVYSPLQKGLLTGKFSKGRIERLPADDHRKRDTLFIEPQLSANLAFVDTLHEIAVKHGRTVAQLAVAWVLRRSEVTAAIAGARMPGQIDEIIEAGDWSLPEDIAVLIDNAMMVRHDMLSGRA